MAYVVHSVAVELLSICATTQTQAISYLLVIVVIDYKLLLSFEARRRGDFVESSESRSTLAALHPVFLANAIIMFAQDRFQ